MTGAQQQAFKIVKYLGGADEKAIANIMGVSIAHAIELCKSLVKEDLLEEADGEYILTRKGSEVKVHIRPSRTWEIEKERMDKPGIEGALRSLERMDRKEENHENGPTL